ncbi:[NiFe]-hydrogenase assembly chaperone HybE [Caenispirillum bisanense]|nr:[NiFe]-hydrogenase assembly chaperone HybE [Caenispirillum bisanense]
MTAVSPDVVLARSVALEDAYRRVEEGAMRGLPVHNAALRVEALGFRPWDLEAAGFGQALLGVVVTPWCMNVVLLPAEASGWADLEEGAKHDLDLPCGRVTFTAGRLEGVGPLLTCSLFSPMQDFADHDGAMITARFALGDLLTPPPAEAPAPEPRRRRTEGPAPMGGPDLSRRAALGMSRTPRGRTPR